MLVGVHAAQVVLAIAAAVTVRGKLRQLGSAAERDAQRRAIERVARALETDGRGQLAESMDDVPLGYPTDLLEAVLEALEGEGDPGSFLHTALLDARHQAIAGVRLIRGLATLSGTIGLLAAMAHYFALRYGDYGPDPLAAQLAEQAASRGALVSMALGLATALGLFLASRTIRARVLALLADLALAVERLERAAERHREPLGAPRAVDHPA